jgi:hypothetical protein
MVITTSILVSGVEQPFSLENVDQYFGGTYRFHLGSLSSFSHKDGGDTFFRHVTLQKKNTKENG